MKNSAGNQADAYEFLDELLPELAGGGTRVVDLSTHGDYAKDSAEAGQALAFYERIVREARRRLATTNSIEHDHMAVRRRTSVVRVFPNEASFLRLGTALALERNEQWLGRRYIPAFAPASTEEALMPAA